MGVIDRLSAVPSRFTLGGLGASEILLTTLSSDYLTDAVVLVAESDLGGLVAMLAGMLFFGYTVFEFLPEVFPDEIDTVTERVEYRLLAAVFVVVSAKVMEGFVGGAVDPTQLTLTLLAVAVIALAIGVLYVAAIAYGGGVDLAAVSEVAYERLDVADPTEREWTAGADAFRTRLRQVVTAGVFLAMPLPFLAIGVLTGDMLYPMPEVLAVSWVFIGAVDFRSDRTLTERLPHHEHADVEGSTFDLVVNTVRSKKGLPVVLVALIGLSTAVILLSVVSSEGLLFARLALYNITRDSLFAWSTLGMLLVLFASATFALWFWVRTIRRVPSYLRAWNAAYADSPPTIEESVEPVTRPIGALLPFAAAMIPAMVYLQTVRFEYFFGVRNAVLTLYGIVWPLSLLLLVWAVHRTRQTDPQPPLSEGRVLPVALLVGWSWFIVLAPVIAFFNRASGMRYPTSAGGVAVIGLILFITVFQFVYPDLTARATDASGWRAHQHRLVMIGVGALCAVGALIDVLPGYGLLLGLLSVLFVIAPVWEVTVGKLF
ncbi:hypothetical protein [Halobellus sp. GM3]|uniref:hypothetical protein n=1 Tax=Halobellus sp. GM3 TaxID=3458410 RepID=UPI00403DD67F